MVTAVFVLGILNLCLGIALAVAVERVALLHLPNVHALLRSPWVPRNGSAQASLADPSAQDSPPADESPRRQMLAGWAAILDEERITTSSPLDNLLWVTKLQTQRMRSRAISFGPKPATPEDVAGLRSVVTEWNDMLSEWLGLATEYKDESLDIGKRFEECLLDQAFELRAVSEALASDAEGSDRLLSLIDAANVLRDTVDELLVARRNELGQSGDLPERFKTFGAQGTLTRLGIEELFVKWWEDDPERLRLVSLVLVDLDRFAKLNKAAGPGAGDVAIEGFAGILHAAVRKDRGFDRVGRLGGDRFLLFLGDTSARNASKGADRIRQTIEASSCRFGDQSMPMTASCAVIEIANSETPTQLLQRLAHVISEAKKAGRNLTYCDDGNGPALVGLPQYEVSSQDLDLQTLS